MLFYILSIYWLFITTATVYCQTDGIHYDLFIIFMILFTIHYLLWLFMTYMLFIHISNIDI
jgi:hypothetical protein